jgi:FkbH-like protein
MSTKKCIVLDLDNTLWGGVVGEDGKDGIALSLTPPGAHFLAFQQALRDLYDRGVLLAINSANNEDDALAVIRGHPNMILKENHFAARRINWIDKVQNMRELASELNIGLDSLVFLDDSPHQREAMRSFLPEVETPELPADPSLYTKFLHSLPYFASEATTDEDKMRGNLYVTERLRREAEKQFSDREGFLESLGTEMTVFEDDPTALARLSQLTEKTNQFNTVKRPLSADEIAAYMDGNEYAVFHARAMDRYGDHGVIAFALVRKGEGAWHIESLLGSCRVLGRGIEDAFLARVAERAVESGVERLSIDLVPTEKNEPARSFVERLFGTGRAASASCIQKPGWITFV